jgi:hypothetical protein
VIYFGALLCSVANFAIDENMLFLGATRLLKHKIANILARLNFYFALFPAYGEV